MSPFLLCVLLLGAAQDAPAPEVDCAEIQRRLHELVVVGASEEDPAWESLVGLGEEAARCALEGFRESGALERALRARLVEGVGEVGCLEAVLRLLDDPDPAVRVPLAGFLGRPSLRTVGAAERSTALRDLVRDDPATEVREAAVEALGSSALPDTARLLEELLEEVPSGERPEIARALLRQPEARLRVVELVQELCRGERELDQTTCAILVAGYGRALVELGEGGERAEERAPLLLARRHPAREIRIAAILSLDEMLQRLSDRGEEERADRLLTLLGEDGWPSRQILYRRAHQAFARGDHDAVTRHAQALVASVEGAEDAREWTWRFYGLHFRAAADFARGAFDQARAGFRAAAELMRRLVAEREELRPGLFRQRADDFPRAPGGGSLTIDRLQLYGLEELWQGLCLLAENADPEQATPALEHLRSAHAALLRAQMLSFATDAPEQDFSWDPLLGRDLAPHALLFARAENPEWGGDRGLDLELLLGRALAAVCADELPGFEPLLAAEPRLADPFLDDARFALLRKIEDEEVGSADREWVDFSSRAQGRGADGEIMELRELRNHPKRLRLLGLYQRRSERGDRPGQGDPARRREVYRELAGYRHPSDLAHTLSNDLRMEGRPEEAEALSRRMLERVAAGILGVGNVWSEWMSARLEMSIASSLMDADRPLEAEREALKALGRLETMEEDFLQRIEEQPEDESGLLGLELHLERTRSLLSNVLVSLAVNANVRLGDQDKALGYFERAYEIDQSEFMRVLLACYRARSNRSEEARAMLARVHPQPQLYYNLACTHALLGDTELALDYLQRELAENHPSPGSLDRQRRWASEDPDLASLRSHPRFQRLVSGD